MKKIEITVSPRRPLVRGLLSLLDDVVALLGIKACQWHIEVVGDAAMKKLHHEHLNDPTTTDVLTFDLRDKLKKTREGSAVVLDTVVCEDEAKRRARELGHTPARELLLYCIHSLLHVQGYDDRTRTGAARMHAREDELLEALGIGPVYSGSKGPPPGKPLSAPSRKRAAR
jgi:probable rRNA maturation factor